MVGNLNRKCMVFVPLQIGWRVDACEMIMYDNVTLLHAVPVHERRLLHMLPVRTVNTNTVRNGIMKASSVVFVC